MKEDVLEFLGFKKKKSGKYYWFELKFKNHKFITNDNLYCKSKFIIGYYRLNDKINQDTFWFDDNLSKGDCFQQVFKALTGHIFCINGNHKKYNP